MDYDGYWLNDPFEPTDDARHWEEEQVARDLPLEVGTEDEEDDEDHLLLDNVLASLYAEWEHADGAARLNPDRAIAAGAAYATACQAVWVGRLADTMQEIADTLDRIRNGIERLERT